MTYEEIIELGWKDQHPNSKSPGIQTFYFAANGDRFIMSVSPIIPEYGTHQVIIHYVDKKVRVNEWENSECWFYGSLKTKEDLSNIMRYTNIIAYE